jgi:hypothetical protein
MGGCGVLHMDMLICQGVGKAGPGLGGPRPQLGVREHTILISVDDTVVAVPWPYAEEFAT